MKKILVKKSEKGIALVEVIAAIGVAIVVITSLVSLAITTMRTSLKSKLLLEGSNMASRELELVRAYRDGVPWANFISAMQSCSVSCHMDGSTVSSGSSVEGSGTEQVTRSFKATKVDGVTVVGSTDNLVRVAVTVGWQVGGTPEYANLYTDYSNWRGQ